MLHLSFFPMLFWLLVGHAICDYPLQGDFLAKAKNRLKPIPGVPWYQALAAHALIHAGMATLITGSYQVGLAEFTMHWLIDDAKCRGDLGDGNDGFDADQLFHVLCKGVWAFLVYERALQHMHFV